MNWLNPAGLPFGWYEIILAACVFSIWDTVESWREALLERRLAKQAGREPCSAAKLVVGEVVFRPLFFALSMFSFLWQALLILAASSICWWITSLFSLSPSVGMWAYSVVLICGLILAGYANFEDHAKRRRAIQLSL